MAIRSDAAMVLFYDVEGEPADHDGWHSHEHLHERLSIPGFLRATRWVATDGGPRNFVTYEVTGTDVATSPAYLARLNAPTVWTGAIMPRFRGMIRGFCSVLASRGYGLGARACVVRFLPLPGQEDRVAAEIADRIDGMAYRTGIASVQVMRPEAPPPMTREQALRGADRALPWLILATGYDADRLDAATRQVTAAVRDLLQEATMHGYALDHTATAEEVARTPRPAVTGPGVDPAG